MRIFTGMALWYFAMSFATAGLRIAQGLAERSAGLSSASTRRIIGQGAFEDAAAGPLGQVQDRISNELGKRVGSFIPEPTGDIGHTTRQLASLQSHFRNANGSGLASRLVSQNPNVHIQRIAPSRTRMPHLGSA